MSPPLQVDSIFAFIRQVAVLFRHKKYLRIYSLGGTCSGMLPIWGISNKVSFDLLTLKVVSESRVTWATTVPILVFLGLSVLDLGPIYAIDRPTDVRQKHRLMPPPCGGGDMKHALNIHVVLIAFQWIIIVFFIVTWTDPFELWPLGLSMSETVSLQ